MMKYGALVVTPLKKEGDLNYINIGDMVQTISVLDLYREMGVKDDQIKLIDINEISDYDGEYLLLPINVNLSLNWVINIFPLPPHIIPVYLGLSFFAASDLNYEISQHFQNYGPVGCRDEATLQLMRAYGISAYLSGCISALLPRRSSDNQRKKIFFIDVPESFVNYADDFIQENASDIEFLSHITSEGNMNDKYGVLQIAQNRLNRYRNEARLVVSSRLHCITPCMAMGIPVIPVTDNISPRMGFIDKFLHYYTPSCYNKVNMNGEVVDYEGEKTWMRNIAMQRIHATYEKYCDVADLSYFYETRDRSIYNNYYVEQIQKLQTGTPIQKYVLWGAGQVGMGVYTVLKEMLPNAEFAGIVDSYCKGEFHGKSIKHPEVLREEYKDAFIFVSTYSGEETAKSFLKEIGREETKDFICLGTCVG